MITRASQGVTHRTRRTVFLLAAVLLAAWFLASPTRAKGPSADIRPALWTVSDADTTVYLFGSVHILRPQDKWRFPAFSRAFAKAPIVYLEAPTDLLSQASLAVLIMRLGLNPPEITLTSRLSPEGRARLAKLLQTYNLEAEALEPLRPWYAFLTLSAAAAAHHGASPAYGVDTIVEADARRAGKEVRTLETLEQQIRIFAELQPETELELLELALEDLIERPEQFLELVDAWSTGDLAEMERLSLDTLRAGPAVFFHRIYTERNLAWAEQLDQLMKEQTGPVMVVVGAAHLIGEASVQKLLAERGYFVARR